MGGVKRTVEIREMEQEEEDRQSDRVDKNRLQKQDVRSGRQRRMRGLLQKNI